MPEGDTIYRAARALQKAIGGKVVTAFETGLAKLARVNDDTPLAGRVVEKVESRGKWCLIFFSGDSDSRDPHVDEWKLAPVSHGRTLADGASPNASCHSNRGLGSGRIQHSRGGVSYGAISRKKQPGAEARTGYIVGQLYGGRWSGATCRLCARKP